MDSCWAACLGDCSNKISREHLVSEAAFTNEVVMVQGLPWCKDAPVSIGLASLTAKILCDKHNSELSPLDDAAGDTLKAMHAIIALTNVRRQMKPRMWNVKIYDINGAKLERWCLKTLININCNREYPVGKDSEVAGRPSERLVRIAYGKESFTGRSGLYFIVQVGMNMDISGAKFQCVPLIKDKRHIEAGLFVFMGLHLLLFLEPEGPPEPLTGIYLNGSHLGDSKLTFHNTEMKLLLGKYPSHRVLIKW